MANERKILRVGGEIKETYAKLSRIYATLEGRFEKKLRKRGLKFLDVQEGDIVLEIGFGTGFTLVELAKAVGKTGKVYGADVTPEMVQSAENRLVKEGVVTKVRLAEADARNLPYKDNMFDAVYMAGVLELFDTPDIPKVLTEIKRVLKPDGRLEVVSIEKENHENSRFLRFYEWVHIKLPRYASCRPIYVEDSIRDEGYNILRTDEIMLGRVFPMKFVIAKPPAFK
ncbi:MAG: class I SAM-dependent methyltransferase [Desulfobacteraceae bacterium]|nr:MAG: class I SAM-dependent methyltransferase [Desulfobacteraceae bacterium]